MCLIEACEYTETRVAHQLEILLEVVYGLLIMSTPSTHSCWKMAWPATVLAAVAASAANVVDFMAVSRLKGQRLEMQTRVREGRQDDTIEEVRPLISDGISF